MSVMVNDFTIPYFTYSGYISKTQIIKQILGRQLTDFEYSKILMNHKSDIV